MIYVISHERSGTHLCINTIVKTAGAPVDLYNVGEWFGPYDNPGRFEHIDRFRDDCFDRTSFDLVKSHCDYGLYKSAYPYSDHVIYVIRHPFGVLNSWWRYLQQEEFYVNNPRVPRFGFRSISEFLRAPCNGFIRWSYSLRGDHDNVVERWANHVAGWWNKHDTVSYESLVAEGHDDRGSSLETIRWAAAHIRGQDEVANDIKLNRVVFGEMESVLPWKGQADGWKDTFSEEDKQFVRDVTERVMVQSHSGPSPLRVQLFERFGYIL